ncbi:hypothetical protein BC936DRAFT_137649 [Jimgerdemannia flammicorona]|uniref:Copper type II ascorbate-dependent monooxygenase N-terminal domain-containing protein n=1 Tax=Jimgerdemannia flammicorona TaxID=994334 RepID=A0A433CWY1_9FUNG|nr:hypothetical protein BC936DRAFT_137649 [Jimgerdemannia flammicorona]
MAINKSRTMAPISMRPQSHSSLTTLRRSLRRKKSLLFGIIPTRRHRLRQRKPNMFVLPTAPNSNTTLTGQIVQIAPVLDTSTIAYVHHYVIYACDSKSAKFQQILNNPTECLTSAFYIFDICPLVVYGTFRSRPSFLALHFFDYLQPWPICNIKSISSTAWAPGTEALTFPANVGLPFGNANDTFDSSSLVIEVHYNNDNPKVTPNLTDASGLSISYTTTKREYDAGLISIGDPSVMGGFMPFGSSKIEKQYICPGECTAKWPWDINVFAVSQYFQPRSN